jgi:hypothetical protein
VVIPIEAELEAAVQRTETRITQPATTGLNVRTQRSAGAHRREWDVPEFHQHAEGVGLEPAP